jgi:DNA-binding response OmpR family regulator
LDNPSSHSTPRTGNNAPVRILLVEDSARVAAAVGDSLRRCGHRVVIATGVREAEEAFASEPLDVAVVDIGLPDGSGLDWCRTMRSAGSQVPILLLTARNAIADRVHGLEAGADDYLGKPFSMQELVARIRAVSRRGPRWTESVRAYGTVVLDRDRCVLTLERAPLPLTTREFEVVALLAWSDGRVVPREDILEGVWGDTGPRAGASLDVHIARIRRKLAEQGGPNAVRTVRSIGYAWSLALSKPG